MNMNTRASHKIHYLIFITPSLGLISQRAQDTSKLRIFHGSLHLMSFPSVISPNPKGAGVYNLTSVLTSVCFSEVYGANSLKLYTLDVNILGAVTRTTPTGFLSNLVQRECLGGRVLCARVTLTDPR